MLKLYDIKKKKKLGIFKSHLEIAEFLEKKKLIGKFYIIPSHFTTLYGIKEIEYDGVFVKWDGDYI